MAPNDNTSRAHKRPRTSEQSTPSPRATSPRLTTPFNINNVPEMQDTDGTVEISLSAANPQTTTSWNDWQGAASLASVLLPPDETLSKKAPSQLPIQPQEPIVAFPFAFGFNTAPKPEPNTAAPSAPGVDRTGGLAIDPALSSLRSSADQRVSNHDSPLPEIEITEETLASASDQNSAALQLALEQARQDAASMDMDGGDHDASGSGGLAPPDSGTKKDQPFSRSPELKITHKLAERKRRKEMKDLFEELGELLPAERGAKSSKWEVLSRAIEHIKSIKSGHDDLVAENQKLRREVEIARGGGSSSFTPAANYQAYNLANYAADGTEVVQADVNAGGVAADVAVNGKAE